MQYFTGLTGRLHIRAVVSRDAGGALAPPEFGSSINPIPARGADYAHHITGSTPGFGNLTTALHIMAIPVVEFSNGGFKIRKSFASESTYP